VQLCQLELGGVGKSGRERVEYKMRPSKMGRNTVGPFSWGLDYNNVERGANVGSTQRGTGVVGLGPDQGKEGDWCAKARRSTQKRIGGGGYRKEARMKGKKLKMDWAEESRSVSNNELPRIREWEKRTTHDRVREACFCVGI